MFRSLDSLLVQKENPVKTGNLQVLTTDTSSTTPLRLVTVKKRQVLAVPDAPKIVGHGAAGVTTYGYRIVGVDSTGKTQFGPEGTTAVGNATLTGVNFNRVTWTAIPGAATYSIYRTTGGTSALINSSLTTPTYDDVDNTAGSAFTFDSRSTDAVNNTTGTTTSHQLSIQSLVLSITTHAAGIRVAFQDEDGVVLTDHVDQAAAALVPSVVRWDFGPHGSPLALNKSLNVLVDDAVGGIGAYIHVEAYERLGAVVDVSIPI